MFEIKTSIYNTVIVKYDSLEEFKTDVIPLYKIYLKMHNCDAILGIAGWVVMNNYWNKIVSYVNENKLGKVVNESIRKLNEFIIKTKNVRAIIFIGNEFAENHEFVHVLWHSNDEYKNEMTKLNEEYEELYKENYKLSYKEMIRLNHYASRVPDEMQAYLSTTIDERLNRYFKHEIPLDILEKYREVFKKFFVKNL